VFPLERIQAGKFRARPVAGLHRCCMARKAFEAGLRLRRLNLPWRSPQPFQRGSRLDPRRCFVGAWFSRLPAGRCPGHVCSLLDLCPTRSTPTGVLEPLGEPCWVSWMVWITPCGGWGRWLERTLQLPFENAAKHLGTEGRKRTVKQDQSRFTLFFSIKSPGSRLWYFSILITLKLSFLSKLLRGAHISAVDFRVYKLTNKTSLLKNRTPDQAAFDFFCS